MYWKCLYWRTNRLHKISTDLCVLVFIQLNKLSEMNFSSRRLVRLLYKYSYWIIIFLFLYQTAVHRFLLEGKGEGKVSLSNYPAAFNIPKDEICSDEGAKVNFERSATRYYDIPPEGIRKNTVPRAMALIHDYLQPYRHQHQVDTFSFYIYIFI